MRMKGFSRGFLPDMGNNPMGARLCVSVYVWVYVCLACVCVCVCVAGHFQLENVLNLTPLQSWERLRFKHRPHQIKLHAPLSPSVFRSLTWCFKTNPVVGLCINYYIFRTYLRFEITFRQQTANRRTEENLTTGSKLCACWTIVSSIQHKISSGDVEFKIT